MITASSFFLHTPTILSQPSLDLNAVLIHLNSSPRGVSSAKVTIPFMLKQQIIENEECLKRCLLSFEDEVLAITALNKIDNISSFNDNYFLEPIKPPRTFKSRQSYFALI